MTGSKIGFVQTDRAAHEDWARLTLQNPAAAALMHVFASNLDGNESITASYKTLADYMGRSVMTVRRAVKVLEEERWIEVCNVGGSVNSYNINARAAWSEKRENLRFAKFHSTILASSGDQKAELLSDKASLRRIPSVYADEQQLPSGEGLPPISQPALTGMELDLPARKLRTPKARKIQA
ncbi:helix-turn-helix domain-containing protein [Falsigemmobacter faecalis]|uniref:Helix-turn-helix domain-containing protein n=1 Tax=Falsigemmobacter faecalis TaxID=2488730 RepID=A0A3P3D410_9RHOB|nr:helix-turn-helix domain-containing protein [Falsigemmobacter faecalis]RRH68326.1 helix-turn-helix domain-containing protein [Falsigemmobacter faecalis]